MIAFEHPLLFLLLPPLAAAVIALGRAPRRVLTTSARLILLLLILSVLAQPELTRTELLPEHRIHLVDVSDSMSPARIMEVVSILPPDADVVAFAGSASPLTERTILRDWAREGELRRDAETGNSAALEALQKWKTSLNTRRSDLAQGLAAARLRFRPGHANWIVLISDGRLQERPAPMPEDVLYATLPPPPLNDVRLVDIDHPRAVRHGEAFEVRVHLESTQSVPATISLTLDHRPESSIDVTLPEGRSTVVLPGLQRARPLRDGLHELQVFVRAKEDGEPRNNNRISSVDIVGKPRLLAVEGSPGAADVLLKILAAQDVEMTRFSISRFSTAIPEIESYDAVALVGVTGDQVTKPAVEAVSRHVAGRGAGLLVIGTPDMNLSGRSLAGTPLETLLPVTPLPPSKPGEGTPDPGTAPPQAGGTPEPHRLEAPRIALLVVLDRSGSMAVGSNLDLAREACLRAADALSDEDSVSVIAFDTRPQLIADFTPANRLDLLAQDVQRISAGGGTDILAALEGAKQTIASPALRGHGIRHVLLLSDGVTPDADFETVITAIRESGATISSICIAGGDFDTNLMRKVATAGGGRFLFANSFQSLPQLFVEEVERVVGERTGRSDPGGRMRDPEPRPPAGGTAPTAGDRPSPVTAPLDHEILRAIDRSQLPPLLGFVLSRPKETSTVVLQGPAAEPVLAVWRFGLGRSAFWLSDLGGRWSRPWSEWKETPKLIAQLFRHLCPASHAEGIADRVRLQRRDDSMVLSLAGDPSSETLTASVRSAGAEARPLNLESTGGRVGCTIPLPSNGEPLTVTLWRSAEHRMDRLDLRLALGYPVEYDTSAEDRIAPLLPPERTVAPDRLANPVLPDRIETRRSDLTPLLLILALLLLPIDVALRRIR